MQPIADGVWQLSSFVKNLFNSFILPGALVDAGTRWGTGRILAQIRGQNIRKVVLTHCHPDHQGAAAAICQKLKIPLACHEQEVAAMEGREPMQPDVGIVRLGQKVWAGPLHSVDERLSEGDEVAGFRVIETPGHTRGHISLFRQRDRLLIAGDVLANVHFFTNKPGLRLPPSEFCTNPAQNWKSVIRLAELDPALICFGHGPPLRDMAEFQSFAERCRGRLASRVGSGNT
jgi:glyoxylase-like metal-dependent hydrolase (beta-lactamase superfamily II)